MGFKLKETEKEFLKNNKEEILFFIKPFYWEEGDKLFGSAPKIGLLAYIDGFGGVFDIDTNNFVM
jgi:hypothetical protein